MARDLIDKEALLARLPELVSTCSSTSHIAREMGVSLDTLRRTLKAEGIPTIYADLAKHFFGPGNPDGGIEEARQLAELVERLPRIPAMSWKKSKGKRQKTALLLVSDIQMGQKVEPAAIFPGATQKLDFLAYSAEVAHRRVKHLFSRLLDLTEAQRAGCDVPELVIFLLGDLVDHSCLRETQTRFVEINAMRQAIEVFHALASGLRAIAPFFPKIRVVSVSGNHGRLDRKMSWFSPTENFDWLVAKMLEEAFADTRHISFDIPETWWAQAEVAGWQFLAFHGEDVRRWCFLPGSRVTLDNYKTLPIEQIQPGMTVLGIDGRAHEVERLHANHHDGEILIIGAYGLHYPALEVTPNHEIAVVYASQMSPEVDHQRVRNGIIRREPGFYKPMSADTVPEIHWAPAYTVSPDDWLVVPRPKSGSLISNYSMPELFGETWNTYHPKEKRIPDTIPVGPELGLLLGQYVGDGSAFSRCIEIVYNEEEESFWSEMMESVERLTGLRPQLIRKNKRARAQRVQIYSQRLQRFIKLLGGDSRGGRGRGKRLHPSVMQWPDDALFWLLVGYLRADGHTARNRFHSRFDKKLTHRVSSLTVSEDLGWQLFWIARRIGMNPSLKTRNRSGQYDLVLYFYGDDARLLGPLTQRNYQAEDDANQPQFEPHIRNFENFSLVRVRSIRRGNYTGPVYDLTVRDEPSYTVFGAAVHNSSFPFVGMTKAAQGYQNVIRTVNREGGDLAHFDYVLAGHHHNPATWESCAGSCEVIMNGTFVPVSEFSLKALREMNRVSQLVGFVSREEGLEERIPVRLMHA